MRVLVAHASRHGATGEIAERIAARLGEAGLTVTAGNVDDYARVDTFDAAVIGSAVYLSHWLKPAAKFVRRHQEVLADKPVWLFASGPLGDDPVDEHGEDKVEVARPKEFEEFAALAPQGMAVFFGAYDPDAEAIGMAERVVKHMPASAESPLEAGDFRDWDAIDAWAAEIAEALTGATV